MMDDAIKRWRALADAGFPPKAPDIGLIEQALCETDTLQGAMALLATVEREDGRCYFGGGAEPSNGHLVTLHRYIDFWHGDPAWTEVYLDRLTDGE